MSVQDQAFAARPKTMLLTRVGRLARRICWLGFADPKKTGWTEHAYWASLPSETRAEYCDEAERLCWLLDNLQRSDVGWNLLQNAIVEREIRKKPAGRRGSEQETTR